MLWESQLAIVLTTSNPGPMFADEHGTRMVIMVEELCMVEGETGGELISLAQWFGSENYIGSERNPDRSSRWWGSISALSDTERKTLYAHASLVSSMSY